MQINKIAIWNTAFLGDAILTLPLIQSLRLAYPEARLHFYTRRGFADLFREHPALEEVHEYDKGPGASGWKGLAAIARFGRTLEAGKYDLWISCHQSLRSAYLARASRAPRRIGYKSSWFSGLCYTHSVDRRFSSLDEIERLLRLLEPLGIKNLSTWPDICLPEAALLKAGNILELAATQARMPLLGLHPGSVWATKRWPAEYFARIGALAIKKGAVVALFAGPGEERMAQQTAALMRRELPQGLDHDAAILNLAGSLSLSELAACIRRLDCYVSNDSGPMHLAWAQHVPLVAIFGPTVRGLGFAPRGKNSVVLEQEDLPCRPCGLHGPAECKFAHHRCMRDLGPDKVWPQVEKYLFGA
jgi:heptosyltransferase-2